MPFKVPNVSLQWKEPDTQDRHYKGQNIPKRSKGLMHTGVIIDNHDHREVRFVNKKSSFLAVYVAFLAAESNSLTLRRSAEDVLFSCHSQVSPRARHTRVYPKVSGLSR
jgi:hypothetical protein